MLSPEGKHGEDKQVKQRSPPGAAPARWSPAAGRGGMQPGHRSASYGSLLPGQQQDRGQRARLLKTCFLTVLVTIGILNTAWVGKSFVHAWRSHGAAAPAPMLNSTTLTVKVSQVGDGAAGAKPYLIEASLDDGKKQPNRVEVNADSGSAEDLISQLRGVGSALGGAFQGVAAKGADDVRRSTVSTGSRRDPVKAEPARVALLNATAPAAGNATAALPASSVANDTAAAPSSPAAPPEQAPHRAELPPPEVLEESTDACSQALRTPKVALLFLTQGDLFHEPTWKMWFRSAVGVLPSSALRSSVCAADEARYRQLRQACLPTDIPDDLSILGQQSLFSVYIHAPPQINDSDLYPLWRGRLIPNRIPTQWGTHSLVEATRNLLHEAFKDPRNTRFVLLSESDIPLYDPLTFYQQLMAEQTSRINACSGDHTMPWRWSWRMNTDTLKVWHWRKSAQWFSIIREHAEVVLRDVEVYRKFEEFCYHGWDGDYQRWRDCFSDEHYIPTLLAVKGLSEQTECGGYGISHTDWSGGGAHPHAYGPAEVTPHLVANLTRLSPDPCNSSAAYAGAQPMFLRASDAFEGDFARTCATDGGVPDEFLHPLPGNCSLTSRKFTKNTVGAVAALFNDCNNGLNLLSPEVCETEGDSDPAEIKKTCFAAEVYEPSDDSFALVDALSARSAAWAQQPPRLCLEIGSGSGYVICSLALMLEKLGVSAHLLATDVNPRAAAATRATLANHRLSSVDILLTDLASALRPRLDGLVDLLVFNPPYVPTPDEEVERGGLAAAWAGGDRGRRVIDRLLPQVRKLLSPTGEMFMVTVHENDPQEILKTMAAAGLRGGVALTRAADEEALTILHFSSSGA